MENSKIHLDAVGEAKLREAAEAVTEFFIYDMYFETLCLDFFKMASQIFGVMAECGKESSSLECYLNLEAIDKAFFDMGELLNLLEPFSDIAKNHRIEE